MKKKQWPRALRERLAVEFGVSEAVSQVEAATRFQVVDVQSYGPGVLMFTASTAWSLPIKARVREHAMRAARVALQGRVNRGLSLS